MLLVPWQRCLRILPSSVALSVERRPKNAPVGVLFVKVIVAFFMNYFIPIGIFIIKKKLEVFNYRF